MKNFYKFQKNIKKTVSAALTAAIVVCNVIPSYALNPFITDEIATVCRGLKDIITSQRESVIKDVKDKILSSGWNYTLTMDCIEEDDVYKSGEYLEIIAAYMAAKQYCRKNDIDFEPIWKIPLLSADIEEAEREEGIPQEIPYYRYIEEKDLYELTDKHLTVIEDGEIPVYEETEDGLYKKTGTEKILLKKRNVKYGQVTFHLMTPEELLDYYSVGDVAGEDYNARLEALNNDTTDSVIYQTLFARTPDFKEFEDFLPAEYDNLPVQRKNIIEIAKSLIGKIPYQWGGKPSKPGYDVLWWTFNEKNEQRGLDCSGFVKWTYLTAGYGTNLCSKLHSTYAMLSSGLPEIPFDELKPGDIGVKIGVKTNHTGIYVGKIAGKDMWIHCSSSKNGVSISEFDFQKFYSPLDYVDIPDISQQRISEIAKLNQRGEELIKTTTDSIIKVGSNGEIIRTYDLNPVTMAAAPAVGFYGEETTYLDLTGRDDIDNVNQSAYYANGNRLSILDFSENDITLLAQLVMSEAGGEGINGQIAVAEIVRNRLLSPLFPNSMHEVIYQTKQFSDNGRIENYTPTEDVMNVVKATLNGQISILNNENCLYYRNPMITSGISPTEETDWGKYRYYTAIGHHAFYLQN